MSDPTEAIRAKAREIVEQLCWAEVSNVSPDEEDRIADRQLDIIAAALAEAEAKGRIDGQIAAVDFFRGAIARTIKGMTNGS